MDPPGSLELVSAAELLARWDCTALMVSNRPMDPAGLIWRGRLPVLAVLAAITFVLLAQSFRATGWWSTAVPAAAFRQRLRATAVQAIAVTLIALFLGTAVHSLGNEGFIANRDAVASVTKRYQSTFLPKLQYSEVKALVGRNDAVLIDARFPPDYDAGHIPGAINLPVSADLSDYQLLRALVPSKARVVVYCQSVGCGFDEEIGSHLSFAGYSDVVLYPGGWADWKEHEHDGD
jgi:rhodanese-related sulfurtransferase